MLHVLRQQCVATAAGTCRPGQLFVQQKCRVIRACCTHTHTPPLPTVASLDSRLQQLSTHQRRHNLILLHFDSDSCRCRRKRLDPLPSGLRHRVEQARALAITIGSRSLARSPKLIRGTCRNLQIAAGSAASAATATATPAACNPFGLENLFIINRFKAAQANENANENENENEL